jgi:hypothetical protein
MPEDFSCMTGNDLYDWVRCHNCTITPLAKHKANVLLIKNPKTGSEAFLNLPIDTQIRDFTVYRVCAKLGIPIPNYTTHLKEIHDRLENGEEIDPLTHR